MSRTGIALDTWSIRYYETRTIAERVLFDVRTAGSARPCAPLWQFWFALLFPVLNHFLGRLLSQLNALEAQRPPFLSEADGTRIPQLLRELVYVVHDIFLCTNDEEGLQNRFALRRPIARFQKLWVDLDHLTERFDNMQQIQREQQRKSEGCARA